MEVFSGWIIADKMGILPMPALMPEGTTTQRLSGIGKFKEKPQSKHAVLAVGYDDRSKTILVRNSYGQNFGNKGYFDMPYSYILDPDLCYDLWVIKSVRDDNDGSQSKCTVHHSDGEQKRKEPKTKKQSPAIRKIRERRARSHSPLASKTARTKILKVKKKQQTPSPSVSLPG